MSSLWYEAVTGGESAEACWELYHENSKTGRRNRHRFDPATRGESPSWGPSFGSSPVLELDRPDSLNAPLGAALARPGTGAMHTGRVPQKTISALMATGRFAGGDWLETYFHASAIEGLPGGLYHYDPERNAVQLMRRGDLAPAIAAALIEPDIARQSAMQVFIAGVFPRATSRLGERGYRAVLMAAGSLAREIALVANALELPSAGTAAFYDRDVDALLALDGLSAGTLYMVAIGAGAS